MRAMPGNLALKEMLAFTSRLLKSEDEPKTFVSLYRILEKVTEDVQNINHTGSAQLDVLRVLNDPNAYDLTGISLQMRIKAIERVSVLIRHTPERLAVHTEAVRFCKKVLQDIQSDISQLEERNVIELHKVLTILSVSQAEGVSRRASELQKELHKVVSEMAWENQEIVQLPFLIGYLSSIRGANSQLDRDHTAKFVEIINRKMQQEDNVRFLVHNFNQVVPFVEISEKFGQVEFGNVLLQKWMEGKKPREDLARLFVACKSYIRQKERAGSWSQEDEAAFQKTSLERISKAFSES